MATSSAVVVPLDEYLNTTYHPDRDWLDGETRERNVGEWQHAAVKGFLVRSFLVAIGRVGRVVLPEQRVRDLRHVT